MATMSSRFYPNPDHEFVLRGLNPSAKSSSQTPGFVRNSMFTHTTKNLSQHEYHPDDYQDPYLKNSFHTLSCSLGKVSGDLKRSLLMEDRDNVRSKESTHYSQGELNEALTDALNSYRPPKDLFSRTSWYTKPIHLSSDVKIPMKSGDMLASRYFPVTLGEAQSLELVSSIKPGRESSRGIRFRSKSAKKQTESRKDAKRLDNVYLMTADAPYIKTAGITFTSPYCDELAKLRMDKLRIEEKQYLELKRQAELEKIRGPKPKWYELRGPEFHYEARKNNELLKNSHKWDELLQYRENLLDATTRLKLALDNYSVPTY